MTRREKDRFVLLYRGRYGRDPSWKAHRGTWIVVEKRVKEHGFDAVLEAWAALMRTPDYEVPSILKGHPLKTFCAANVFDRYLPPKAKVLEKRKAEEAVDEAFQAEARRGMGLNELARLGCANEKELEALAKISRDLLGAEMDPTSTEAYRHFCSLAVSGTLERER